MSIFGREIRPAGKKLDGLYILGEAPGEKEDRVGVAFIGASGNLLFKTLLRYGITRDMCRIANVFWRRPPGNSIDQAKKHPDWGLYREKTKEDILSSKPRVILALGSEALKLLFPDKNISSARGYIWEWCGIPVIPTWHPASIFRNPAHEFSFRVDLKKVAKVYQEGFDREAFTKPLLPMYPNDKEKLIELLNKIASEKMLWSLDIECSQKPWRCNCIGIACSEGAANSYPFPDVIEALKKAVKENAGNCILHNANFDLSWLYGEFGIEFEEAPHDTMVMHHVLLCDQPKSLEFCVSVYLTVPSWKELRWSQDEQKWIYNLLDCIYTLELFKPLKEELCSLGAWDVYDKQKRKELLPAVFMGLLGVRLDAEKMQEHRLKIEQEMAELEQVLFALSGELNLNSPKQLKELLYSKWKLPVGKYKGKVSVKDEVIESLIRKNIPDIYKDWLKKYLEWKSKSSIISKELKIEPCIFTGLVHTSYNIAGTEGARWSSSAPLWGGGTNMQNRSKPFRDIYLPRYEDFVFISSDYGGAEARIVAWRCNDEVCKQAFLEGQDIHKLTASMMFGVKIEDVTKELRTIGKRIRHAANYDMSWRKLAQIMGISGIEAKELLARYHRAYPKIREIFHQKTIELIRKYRLLKDAWGLPRVFTGRLDDSAFREGFAFYPQSTCTHTLNKALLELWEWSKDLDWVALQFQIHDEIVLLVHKDKVMEAAEALSSAMKIEIPIENLETGSIDPLVLPADFKIGFNFGDMHECDSLDDLYKKWKELCS